MNDTAKLIKAKYPSTYRFIENVKHSVDIESLALYTKVYSDPEAMANHVIKIHSGEQSGAGQITWSSNEKDTFTAQFIGQQFNLGNLIYRKLEVDPNNKELYGKIKTKVTLLHSNAYLDFWILELEYLIWNVVKSRFG